MTHQESLTLAAYAFATAGTHENVKLLLLLGARAASNRPATLTVDLAGVVDRSPAAVAGNLKALAVAGLVATTPSGGYILTKAGGCLLEAFHALTIAAMSRDGAA